MNEAVATPAVVHVPALSALATVRHGFFTRSGGASSGLYEPNNCAFGSDDDHGAVSRNREASMRHLGAKALVTVKQHHTADVVTVTTPWTWEGAPVADALVTAELHIAIGILTADCGPVLFADAQAGVIGAAHTGWRGAFDGVLENTVAAMEDLGARADRIVAALGPCIAQASYEVGPEFMANITERDETFARYFTAPKANGHMHFDLPGFIADCLRAAGVGTVIVEGSDTCTADAQFFSYRRSVLRKERDYGRQLSAIAIL